MFSQNVFSARDVQMNSALNECNAGDSQPYSQVMCSSQNSQMSSVEMFSQQKVPLLPSKFDQYQRSQSQPTEDEPPNYYSKYVNNPPLFPSKNYKLARPIQAFIEEEKQSISMKEERDMLQVFINLLKDYTKEVDSSFKTFKNDMQNTLQTIAQNMQNGTQHIDEKVTHMRQELISIFETKDKESYEKQELDRNISEQSGTIKILETKAGILEKQLDEMKNKESAYVEQKTKFQELEQKYLQCINQRNEVSCLRNTPPLSQHINPPCGFQIPPLHHDNKVDLGNTFPNAGPSSSTGYGYNPWQTQTNDYYNPAPRNNPLPMPNLNLHQANMASCASNQPYPTTTAPQAKTTSQTGTQNSVSYQMPSRLNQSYSYTTESAPSTHCSKVCNTGSPAPRSCGLNISRRNSKRPKQSPIAMVKPQVREPSSLIDDEIFLCGVVNPTETSKPTITLDENDAFHTPYSGPLTSHVGSNCKKKGFRQEDTLRRKRSSISMLGIPTDDSEVQEITKALNEQTRRFSKRTKSLP